MALSFEDSLKSQINSSTETKPEVKATLVSFNDNPKNEMAAYSNLASDNSFEEWQVSHKYLWYDEYRDNEISTINSSKDITVHPNQINLTQESNSQFIPFEMPRYYDGVDLLAMNILIHYVTSEGYEDFASPVNVSYSNDKIKFAWLISKNATTHSGELKFEVHAIGVTSKGDEYIWKTKPNGKFNILKSLEGNGVIEPDESWITSFLTQVNEKVSEAQTSAQDAQNAADQAQNAIAKVDNAVLKINTTIDTAKQELQDSLNESITTALLDYYTKTEVDDLLRNIDLTKVYEKIDSIDGLANFKTSYDEVARILTFYNGTTVISTETLNSNPTAEWVTAYDAKVDNKISESISAVQSDLSIMNNDLAEIHKNIDDLPDTLKTNYYPKEEIDSLLDSKADKSNIAEVSSKISVIESATNTNQTNISTIGEKVSDLENTVNSIDTSPKLSYEATYDEEQIYTLWEIEGEGDHEIRTPKGQFKIQGGGGGTSTSSVLKIEYITKTPLIVTSNDRAIIKYNFSGIDSSGDEVLEGTAIWRIGNSIIATNTVIAGENTFDATNYVSLGSQKLTVSITDDAGSLVTKSWTVQKIDVRIESTFNDQLTYPIGNISFDYIPYGAISKEIHFILDGNELPSITTSSSGVPMAYTLPSQPHGSHILDVYITAEINNSIVESNHIVKDIIWYDTQSSQPVISCVQQNISVRQYDTTNIIYTVFDPTTESPKVSLAVDEEVISNLTLDNNTQTWQYKALEVGKHTLTITCKDIVKTLSVVVEKLDINIEPVTANLAFDFNPSGKSNNDDDKLWSYEDVSMSVSDNFDWVNGGYQIDDNGDQYFCVKAGTSAVIHYNLFSDDAKRNGKEFKIVFKTTNVRKSDATFLSCLDGDSLKIGLEMNVHEAYVHASAGKLYLPYSEEDIIEFEININKNTDIPMVMGYEDGVATRPMIYNESHDFTQLNPKDIFIGSEDCDVHIYRIKAYSSSLADTGILNNFIADARSADEMIRRYTRNQIYDENNVLTPESLAKACPELKIIKLECPHLTNDKKDFVKNTNIECIHTGGDPVLDNWTARNCYHSGQGTTSNEYGAAGRNLDLLMCFDGNYKNKKITYDESYKTVLTMGDGTKYEDGTGKVSLTRNSVPTNYFNIKVNIASSENVNNAGLQNRYNKFLPYKSVAQQNNPDVKNSMEFVNCVVFLKESDPDITTHREFSDCDWHFYAMGNIGDSKKTDNSRVNDPTDPKEFVVEIMDNTLPNSTFSGTAEALAALDADVFDEEGTYGFRYEMSGITDTQRQENMQIWRDFYRFVCNSTDEEFVSNLGDWFIVDSALYFYLFTERYTMIDNRAKNTFWHYAKCEDGKYRFDLWDYDNDTGLGINNSGELTMTYGKEDTDYRADGDPSSGYIFNGAKSKFFCRIRDLMYNQLSNMFIDRESQNCWSATNLINEFDEWQAQFPEELWRLDIERKYLRTYRDGNTRFLVQMMNGRKKYQRRQFERDQEKYMATKYFGTTATSDQIMFRCNTPVGAVINPDYTLHLTPYSDMYLSVMFGATYRTKVRAKAGQQYDISCPFSTMDDTAVLIYCASRIQAIGDLSGCYIHDNDFSKANKLQELIIGNSTEGYQNTFLTNLGIGNNTLLQRLDIQNTPNLSQSLNLSSCGNLEELYAYGSGLTGVIFADGGKITLAHLPSISSITMRNLSYLTELDITGFNNLSTLIVENCNTIDVKDILNKSNNMNRVRIIGIDWTLEDSILTDKIYEMYGIDKNGYNISQSVLSGHIHIPVMREQKFTDYQNAWPDLSVTYDSVINQFAVTFLNDDGTILDIQYIDKGSKPVDPITRENNPIDIPTKESTISTDFSFTGWDTQFTNVFSAQTITATYSESLRRYTVKFVSKGIVLQESAAEYGSTVFYEGDIPIYTAEEAAYKYHLFSGWDKSGFVDGNKTISAVYDTCEYTIGYFENKDLNSLRPVDIYAMTRVGIETECVDLKDTISFELGHDFSYEDIEEHVLISEKTEFKGDNYIDTGISIFDEDRDFVLAIDYKFSSDNTTNAVLAQCYQSSGTNGFRLWYNSDPRLSWGTSSLIPSASDAREMLILRHIKGEYGLHVYSSNLDGDEIKYTKLSKSKDTISNSTVVFGCEKASDGAFENYAKGTLYWSKIWYADLGDEACKKLASWTHESRTFEMCGFKKYYLSNNSSKRCSMTFLDSHLLSKAMALDNSSSNKGGWAVCKLNSKLNTRLYSAIPDQWKQLIKQVQISSSIGNKSNEISISDCYITIPSLIEVDPSMSSEPYIYEGTSIPFLTTNQSRICNYDDGAPGSYWLRSPNVSYASYYYRVNETGDVYGYQYAYINDSGVRLMFSI